MDSVWTITLFGGLSAIRAGGREAVTRFRTRKSAALLARLAFRLAEAPLTRDELIEILWPYADPDASLARLAVELTSLRKLLEPVGVVRGSIVRADRFAISLDPALVTTDVAGFETNLRRARLAESSGERHARLAAAVDLYTGSFLPQIDGDWIEPERERLATRFVAASEEMIDSLIESGETGAALEVARSARQRERFREAAHVLQMRTEIAAGRPADALKTLESLRIMLRESIGSSPGRDALRLEADARHALAAPPATLSTEPTAAERRSSDRRALPLPTGTLAILATDIEGSTAMGRSLGDERFALVLARHHALMRAEFVRANGIEFNEAGDGFWVAFEGAGDALRCACECQRALARARAAAGNDSKGDDLPPVRVRMAIHVGDLRYTDAGSVAAAESIKEGSKRSEPAVGLRGAGSYRGMVLHDLARLLSATNGEQIYLSEAAEAVLRRNLPSGVVLADRGRYRLRDAPGPESIFEAVWDTSADPDKSRTPDAQKALPPTGLPSTFTRFFGRDAELAALTATLTNGTGSQLVTLTGMGGSGKTRLATETARLVSAQFDGGVWFVDLVRTDNPARIGDAIRAIVAPDVTGELFAVLGSVFRPDRVLIMLDNLEHLLGSDDICEFLQTLLEKFPKLQCLATSRQRIGVVFEQEVAVQPLPVPGNRPPKGASAALDYACVALFEDRAKRARFDFQVTERNAVAVSNLCARLEGIPLALELAAAWARLLSPAEMLTQFDEIRRTRDRDVPERHRSLDAAIEGSYRLLDDEQRAFFRGLSVFRGGWTLAAAKRVCDEPMALALLGELRDRSLVVVEDVGDTTRYRFLETVRTFAAARLAEAVIENSECQERLVRFYAGIAAEANDALEGAEQADWLSRLAEEHQNLTTVLQFADRPLRLTIASQLHRYFMLRGYLPEARRYFEDVLSGDNSLMTEVALNKAINVAGVLALTAGDLPVARSFFVVSAERCRAIGDERAAGAATVNLGIVARLQGDLAASREAYESTLDLWRRLNRTKTLAGVLSNLGRVTREQGDLSASRSYLDESLALQNDVDDRLLRANTLENLGTICEALTDLVAAAYYVSESLRIRITLDDNRGIALLIPVFASLEFSRGNVDRAARLYGAAQAAQTIAGIVWPGNVQTEVEGRISAVKASLGAGLAQTKLAEGQSLQWEQIVAEVLEFD